MTRLTFADDLNRGVCDDKKYNLVSISNSEMEVKKVSNKLLILLEVLSTELGTSLDYLLRVNQQQQQVLSIPVCPTQYAAVLCQGDEFMMEFWNFATYLPLSYLLLVLTYDLPSPRTSSIEHKHSSQFIYVTK